MYFRYVQIEALIFLENELILKVVVYVGEATARRIGNGSFDQKKNVANRELLVAHHCLMERKKGTTKEKTKEQNKTKQNKTKTNSNRARDSNLTRD